MNKVKVTLAINPYLLKYAKEHKMNLSRLLEGSILKDGNLELRTIVIERIEQY